MTDQFKKVRFTGQILFEFEADLKVEAGLADAQQAVEDDLTHHVRNQLELYTESFISVKTYAQASVSNAPGLVTA